MKTLCIVPCGARKIWDKYPDLGPTEARKVYIGPFATKCRAYAEHFYPVSWCILSAKYGFLLPNDIVLGPYNISFNDKNSNPINHAELSNQTVTKGLNEYDRIVILGGKNYVKIITQIFPKKEIQTPLSDSKGIGYMMGKINNLIQKGTPM